MSRTADRSRSGARGGPFGAVPPALALAAVLATPSPDRPPLSHEPVVWHADDRRDVPMPQSREVGVAKDAIREIFFRPVARATHPGRLVRSVGALFGGEAPRPAANVNRLDEVPSSSWFTNRIGLFPFSPTRAARGPGTGTGPDRGGPWTVVAAKTEGVTAGFTILDPRGKRYLIKFDPPGYSGIQSAAGVIAGRILYAAGYNVPDDAVVFFRRDRLRVGPSVTIPGDQGPRPMTEADLTSLLAGITREEDGTWRALASEILPGRALGPFDWQGTRDDDPNDRVNHEDRRELRGYRVFASWICHFDTKQLNSLDVWVEEDGRRFVEHYFIDFASTFGTGFASTLGAGPRRLSRKYCFEYTLDGGSMWRRLWGLGFVTDDWRSLERPTHLEEIGYYESEIFDPMDFQPYQGNGAFAKLTRRDGYWAAKIISAFTDQHLEAIVAEGKYREPGAARYLVRTLAERRDLLARAWFDRVPPLDFFFVEGGRLRFHDLGVERGLYPASRTRYRVRTASVDEDRKGWGWSEALELRGRSVPLPEAGTGEDPRGFVAAELRVSRGEGWSDPVTVYVSRRSGEVVGLDR